MYKYTFTKNIMTLPEGIVLHQIIAKRDFGDIKAGTLGGFLEDTRNLSQSGNCWLTPGAVCYNEASISGNAFVTGQVKLFGRAMAGSDCVIEEFAILNANCYVGGRARIGLHSFLSGVATASDDCVVRCLPIRRKSGRLLPHMTDMAEIRDRAKLLEHGSIRHKGVARGDSTVRGSARILEEGSISAFAIAQGRSTISGKGWASGHCILGASSRLTNNAVAFGSCRIGGRSLITGSAQVGGTEVIHDEIVSGDECRCKVHRPPSPPLSVS